MADISDVHLRDGLDTPEIPDSTSTATKSEKKPSGISSESVAIEFLKDGLKEPE